MSGRELLRTAGVRPLLAAEVISVTGSQMTWLALPWFVLHATGSATRMSAVVGAAVLGLGLLGLPGGKLLGWLGAWRTMVLCDGVRGPLMLAVPLLHWAGALSFGALLALTFALGAFSAPYFAAQKVIVPELLGEDEALVSRAAALFQAAVRITMLLGPLAGGVLISVVSAPVVLVVDAATYVVAAALVALRVPRRRAAAQEETGSIRAGLRFLVREPLLRVWTPVLAVGDAAWSAFFVSVPFLVVTRFGGDPRVAGWLLASFGVGAVAGNALAYRYLLDRYRGLSVIAAFALGQALPLWVLTGRPAAAVASTALACSGLANGLVNPSLHALLTLRVPPHLRASALTSMALVFGVVQPLGIFGAGPVLDAFGAQPLLVAFAAIQTLAMGLMVAASLRARRLPAAEPSLAPAA